MRQLWKARDTVIEMLKDRSFAATQQPLTYSEFMGRYPTAETSAEVLNFVATKSIQESGEERLLSLAVHFTTDEKLSKAALEKLVNEYISQAISTVILVTPSKLNPSCKAFLKATAISVEHFLMDELQLNVTKHVLVPRHRIISQIEKEELLKRLRTVSDNLPVILTADPVCRYVGGQPGDVIEIERKSLTAGTALYYRIVKEG